MNKILKSAISFAAIACCAPAMAFTTYPDTDFEWYANVGRNATPYEAFPAPRAGYIWSPGHSERGTGWVPGHWIRDDYFQQLALHGTIPANPNPTIAVYRADGSLVLAAPLPAEITIR